MRCNVELVCSLVTVLSVRSTNVYEEKSLGIYHGEDEAEDDEEAHFNPVGNRYTVWSRYLAMHMRKQLSFGEYTSFQGRRRFD